MNPKEHRKDFSKRWNINLHADSPIEAFQKFTQRIWNILQNIDQMVTNNSHSYFCQYYGIAPKFQSFLETPASNITIADRLFNENNKQELCRLIEVILFLDFNYHNKKLHIIEQVKQAVEMSDIDVEVGKSQKGYVILYPKGEKVLDNELVNQTLSFLDEKSNKHFEEALKFYQNKKHKESAERLRQSVEEFLRYKLQNTKGLPENLKAFQLTLKTTNNSSQIRNVIFQVFNYLDQYFNAHSKHGDNVNEIENEFLIYQTGLLLRYMNRSISKVEANKEK